MNEALRRALTSPPKPHSAMKLGRRKAKASRKASFGDLVNPSQGRNDYRYHRYRHRDDSDFALVGRLLYVVPIPDPFGQAVVVHEVIFLLSVAPANESAHLLLKRARLDEILDRTAAFRLRP